MILINIEEKPIKSDHISYYVQRHYSNNKQYISLYEIKNYHYIHPQSDGMATISQIDYELVCSFGVNELIAAPLFLLENALNTIKLLKSKLKERYNL